MPSRLGEILFLINNPRAYLVLGRVSNISTLWSNCLCAWLLGGGGEFPLFLASVLGLSLIYLGGMYLNDYCDADWDLEFRSERPIPSGQVNRGTVLAAVVFFIVAGSGCLLWSGWQTLPAGAVLLLLIVLYNHVHKRTALGVPLMAGCRMAVYWVVGAVSLQGVTPEIGLAGILMFFYVLGITWLARGESKPGTTSPLALVSLAAPVLAIALLGMQNPGFQLLVVAMAAGWMLYVFRGAMAYGRLKIGKTIGPLLAGICWVDLAILGSLGYASVEVGLGFVSFFLLALAAQRFIPAS